MFSLLLLSQLSPPLSAGETTTSFSRPTIPTDELCPVYPKHSDFRVRVGTAKGRNPGKTIAAARQDAFDQLADQICLGAADTPRCYAGRQNIAPYGAGMHDADNNAACASVTIEARFLDPEQHALDALESTMSTVAAQARVALDGAPVQLVAPVWSVSGCTAGELGAHLLTVLRAHLGGVVIVPAGEAAVGMKQLRLQLSTDASRVRISASVRAEGTVGWTSLSLPNAGFPLSLFNHTANEQGACEPIEAAEGPLAEHRPGAGGLWARLDAPAEGGVLCAGESVSPQLLLGAPARVRLYSVQADGQGYQIWPWNAEDDRVYGPGDQPGLPALRAIETFNGSDSTLVAVAYPEGTAAPAAGLCQLAGHLQQRQLPAEAAYATARYSVSPAAQWVCQDRGDADQAASLREAAAQLLRDAETCR